MTLSVEIRHLIVDAPGPVDPRTIRAELEAELMRRFAEGGARLAGGAIDRVALHLPPVTSDTGGLGARLGQAVHGAIGGVGGQR